MLARNSLPRQIRYEHTRYVFLRVLNCKAAKLLNSCNKCLYETSFSILGTYSLLPQHCRCRVASVTHISWTNWNTDTIWFSIVDLLPMNSAQLISSYHFLLYSGVTTECNVVQRRRARTCTRSTTSTVPFLDFSGSLRCFISAFVCLSQHHSFWAIWRKNIKFNMKVAQ